MQDFNDLTGGGRAVSAFSFSAFAGEKRAVNWRQVDATLRLVPREFTDARFDPLSYVLNTLSSRNAEAELAKLEQLHQQVELLVDDIVASYFNGFNKATHNYSQILSLFADAKGQVEVLREALEVARRRLGSSSASLQQTWLRTTTLGDTLRLLDDVQALVNVPEDIHKHMDCREYDAAVDLLLDAGNKLQRPEIRSVAALRDVRREIAGQRKKLAVKLFFETLREVFFPRSAEEQLQQPASSEDATKSDAPGQQLPQPSTPSSARAAAAAALLQQQQADGAFGSSSSLATAQGLANSFQALGCSASFSRFMTEPGGSAAVADVVRATAKLVGDPAEDMHAFFGKHHGALMQKVMGHVLQRAAADLDASVLGDDIPAPPPEMPSLAQPVPQSVQEAARYCALRMAAATLQVVENVKVAALVVGTRQGGSNRSGIEALCTEEGVPLALGEEKQQQQSGVGSDSQAGAAAEAGAGGTPTAASQQQQRGLPKPTGQAAVRLQLEQTWGNLQEQQVKYFTQIFHTREAAQGLQPAPSLGSAQASLDEGGELENVASAFSPVRDTEGLTFSFDADADTATVHGAGGSGGIAGPDDDDDDMRKRERSEMKGNLDLLSDVLGGWRSGAWVVPVVYPLLQGLVDDACRIIDAVPEFSAEQQAQREGWREINREIVRACSRGAGSSASPNAPGSYGASSKLQNIAMRSFLDNYVRMEFLPQVYVDFRGQCTQVLASPDALRAHTRHREEDVVGGVAAASKAGGGAGADGDGMPPLPAAVFAQQTVGVLLGWARQMPLFATNLAGVVENILGRVLDAFAVRSREILKRSAAAQLADDPDVLQWMAQEPGAAALGGGGVLAFVPLRSSDDIDAAVQRLQKMGLGTGGKEPEQLLLRRLLGLRPLPISSLVGGPGESPQLLQLVALSDSLDAVADAIHSAADTYLVAGGSGGGGGPSDLQGPCVADLRQSMLHLRRRYLTLSGYIMRALKLEAMLFVLFFLQELPRSSYICEEDEAKEVDECVGAVCRAEQRASDDLIPGMSARKRDYVFGNISGMATQAIMWLLPDIKGINAHGVARMCNMLSVLQPSLSMVDRRSGQGSASAAPFERARGYFQQLTLSSDALIKTAAANPKKYSADEWRALLQAHVPGRSATDVHREQLDKVLKRAGL